MELEKENTEKSRLTPFPDQLYGQIQAASSHFKHTLTKVTAAAIVGGTASLIGGGKFENGAVTGAFSALTIAFITDSTFRSNIFNGVKRVSSTIWFGAKILGADFAALGIGQTYGNYTVAKSDLFNLWNAAKSWNVKGISINLFKTIHHIVIPKNGWYGGAGYGLEQFPNGQRTPFNLQDWANMRHDDHGMHLGWVSDSWTGNSSYLSTGPFGQAYKLLGTAPFSAAGGLQKAGFLP